MAWLEDYGEHRRVGRIVQLKSIVITRDKQQSPDTIREAKRVDVSMKPSLEEELFLLSSAFQ